ncbi:hypothetical protein NL676_030045 [Syzygium grande]|nr:hypothetical protein NL676_030045 [Syzygium grande]
MGKLHREPSLWCNWAVTRERQRLCRGGYRGAPRKEQAALIKQRGNISRGKKGARDKDDEEAVGGVILEAGHKGGNVHMAIGFVVDGKECEPAQFETSLRSWRRPALP